MYTFDREAYNRRVKWFTQDRFGMFIHWGLYAIPARGEWVRSPEAVSYTHLDVYKRQQIPFLCSFICHRAWEESHLSANCYTIGT